MAEYTLAHVELCAMLDNGKVNEWTAMVEAWERNPSLQNPFEPSEAHKGMLLLRFRVEYES